MTDVAARSYLPTPLHARTAELCATNAWTEQCGFTVPAVYASLREEQDALGSRVALSDLSARQCWSIEGPDAAAFLSFATITDVTALGAGQTARTLWCDDDGFVRGDGVITHFGKGQFELSTAVRDFAWMLDGARGFDVKIANATGARAVIGVRGPLAANLLTAAGLAAEGANAGGLVRPAWRPAQVALTRDAAGEGFELSMQADDGVLVWDRLWRSGAPLGIAAAGAQALEAERVEQGAPRAAVDWQAAHLARDPADLRLPVDLGFAPDLMRRFNGVEALRAKPGARQVLVQFTADEPLMLGPLSMRSVAVGRLTSQTWSEARAAAFALGWLDADAVKVGTKLSAPGPTGPLRAEIVRQVFAG
jgi:glycine cleavage system aminomethyltransferase T